MIEEKTFYEAVSDFKDALDELDELVAECNRDWPRSWNEKEALIIDQVGLELKARETKLIEEMLYDNWR